MAGVTTEVGPATRAHAGVEAHATTALICGVITIGHMIAIWNHRHVGALNVDESTHLALAHQIRDGIADGNLREVVATGTTGPLMPTLSAILLAVGPDDPRTALLAQPLIVFGTCLGISSLTRRIGGGRSGTIAATGYLLAPATVAATSSYFLGATVAAVAVFGLWSLLASDRGSNGWVWGFGLSVALLPLSRSMAIAYVPALVTAGLAHSWTSKRGRRRVTTAALVGCAAATAVLALNWQVIWEYLSDAGYGRRSAAEFPGNPLLRPVARAGELVENLGGWITLAAVGAVIVLGLSRSRGTAGLRGRARSMDEPVAALCIFVALAYAALITTANKGDWFDLPIMAVLLPLIVLAVRSAPRWSWPLAAAPAILTAALALGNAWWVLPTDTPGRELFLGRFRHTISEGLAQNGDQFFDEDPRFAPTRRDLHARAASEWADLASRVNDRVAELVGHAVGADIELIGSASLFNNNQLILDAVIRDLPLGSFAAAEPAESSCVDSSTSGPRVRLFAAYLGEHRGRDGAARAADARRHCWTEADRFRMPNGGQLVVMVHD